MYSSGTLSFILRHSSDSLTFLPTMTLPCQRLSVVNQMIIAISDTLTLFQVLVPCASCSDQVEDVPVGPGGGLAVASEGNAAFQAVLDHAVDGAVDGALVHAEHGAYGGSVGCLEVGVEQVEDVALCACAATARGRS